MVQILNFRLRKDRKNHDRRTYESVDDGSQVQDTYKITTKSINSYTTELEKVKDNDFFLSFKIHLVDSIAQFFYVHSCRRSKTRSEVITLLN